MTRPERIRNELVDEFGLWFLIKEDYACHFRDWTRPGFRAMTVYRFGTWARGLESFLLMAIFYSVYLRLQRYIRNSYGIEISAKSKIGRRLHIGHQNGIVVHEYATIGDDCRILQGATLGAGADFSQDTAPVLGNRVEVGPGAMIIGKVQIGDDVRIGPNAVVMHDVPANTSVIAPPSRFLPRPAVGKPQDEAPKTAVV
jgi:serine O-acetyltransferase